MPSPGWWRSIASELDPATGLRLDAIGFGFALGAAVSQAIFVVISRSGYRAVPADQAMGVVLAVTLVCSTVAAVLTSAGSQLAFPVSHPSVLPILAFTGTFAAAIPSILFLTGIRVIGGTRAGILMLFEPVVGVALAAWLLDEGLTTLQVAGGLAILAAAVILQRSAATELEPVRTVAAPAVEGDLVDAAETIRSRRQVRSRRRAGGMPGTRRSLRARRGSARLSDPIRVLLVDDHAMVRRGMRDFLGLHDDLEVVGEAGDGRAAIEMVDSLLPDVVVMDLLMPGMDGIAATSELKQRHPGIEVVVITSFIEEDRITAAMEAGASGFLLKDAEADDLAAAIRAAHAGEVVLDPAIAGIVARRMRNGRPGAAGASDAAQPGLHRLTIREREVLGGVARGLSNREIADELGITERTARTHVSNILAKLGLSSRTQAALLAVERYSDRDR